MIRPAAASDAEAIARIYNHYVLNTVITFEEEEVSATQMAARIADVQAASFPWLVAEAMGQVVGYAYVTKKVAHFEQVGFKFDQWLDVGYWQTVLA